MARDELSAATPDLAPDARRERLALPGVPASVPQARRFVRGVLAAWGRDQYDEAGTLLVSELVTNVVLHARTDVEVELVDGADGVLLGVTDGATTLPVQRRHTREAGTGRGLWLMDQYALRHGVEVTGSGAGKQVWAVLRREDDAGATKALATWLDQLDGL